MNLQRSYLLLLLYLLFVFFINKHSCHYVRTFTLLSNIIPINHFIFINNIIFINIDINNINYKIYDLFHIQIPSHSRNTSLFSTTTTSIVLFSSNIFHVFTTITTITTTILITYTIINN